MQIFALAFSAFHFLFTRSSLPQARNGKKRTTLYTREQSKNDEKDPEGDLLNNLRLFGVHLKNQMLSRGK